MKKIIIKKKEYDPEFLQEIEEIKEDKPIRIHSYDELFEADEEWIHFNSLEELDQYLDEDNTSSFNIFDLLEENCWTHILLKDYLATHDIIVDYIDVWGSDLIIILGYTDPISRISEVLGVHPECVYIDYSGLLIINLFQERYLRGEL